jgi:hypothetical protein
MERFASWKYVVCKVAYLKLVLATSSVKLHNCCAKKLYFICYQEGKSNGMKRSLEHVGLYFPNMFFAVTNTYICEVNHTFDSILQS